MANNNETALDRLNKLQEPSDEREFTLEEQMDSVSTDEFLDGMSLAAKSQMSHLVEEVTLDDDEKSNNGEDELGAEESTGIPEGSEVSPSESEELFNNNNKPKREYKRRNKSEGAPAKVVVDATDNASNPVFDQVAKDLVDDLRKRNYKINRFDDKSMAMIFDYMYSKF